MTISILLVIHVLLSLSIIGLVLLQRGKGAEAGAALGGGASGSVFGAQGAANFLSRTTAILATSFFVTSLGLAYLSSNQQVTSSLETGSVLEQTTDAPAAIEAPSDIPTAADAPVTDSPVSGSDK